MSVGTTANPAADCGAANVRCINQPDAKWTTPNSNIFDKFPLTNNDRTVDFTDPKTRNGVAGIDKGENFVDGKVYPTKPPPTLPVLVESSFSVPPAKADSKGKSVTYDAADSTLSFSNDFITKTFDPADPVLGAEVSPPSFKLAGFSGSQVEFTATTPLFTIHNGPTTFMTGELDVLTYFIATNKFVGTIIPISIAGVAADSPFFDSALPGVISEFLQGIDEYLNPNSTLFDPNFPLIYTSQPDLNLYALTDHFSAYAESSLTDSVILQIPEPSTWAMMLLGLAGLGYAGYRRAREPRAA
jgi:PEP-CTERM motif